MKKPKPKPSRLKRILVESYQAEKQARDELVEFKGRVEIQLENEIHAGAHRRRKIHEQAKSLALTALLMSRPDQKADRAAIEEAARTMDARRQELSHALAGMGRLWTKLTGREFADIHEENNNSAPFVP